MKFAAYACLLASMTFAETIGLSTVEAQEALPPPISLPTTKPVPGPSAPDAATPNTTPPKAAPSADANPPAPNVVAPVPAPGLAPPAGLRGPDQRRERLRRLGGLLNTIINQPNGPGGANGPKLDYGQINDVVRSLFQSLLNGDATFESFELVFDPAQTDLNADKLALAADAVLRRSGWSDQPSHFHLEAQANADLRSPGGAKAKVVLRLTGQTSVVALADFALQRYKIKHNNTPASEPTTTGEYFQAALAEKMARIEHVNNFEEVADLYQSISSLHFAALADAVDRAREALAAAPDDNARERSQAELTVARQARDAVLHAKRDILRDASGQVRELTMSVPNAKVGGAAQIESLDVSVTETELSVVATVQVQQGVEVYALAKPLIFTTLQALQNRDPAAVQAQRNILRGILDFIRPLLAIRP
jgi:hypothetical protein